jgi:hypothetical protein
MHDWNEVHTHRLLIDEYLESGGTMMSAAFREAFPTEDDLVRELHQRWVHILDGCLETELETGSGSPMDALRDAYVTASRHAPELRRMLTTFADSPVLAGLTDHHDAQLAAAVGALRPSHTIQEGIDEVRHFLDVVSVPAQGKPSRLERWRRDREVSRLITASLRGY